MRRLRAEEIFKLAEPQGREAGLSGKCCRLPGGTAGGERAALTCPLEERVSCSRLLHVLYDAGDGT